MQFCCWWPLHSARVVYGAAAVGKKSGRNAIAQNHRKQRTRRPQPA
nr:MAG TPA: hypothetical protein [Caudoviricetes sp.]